MEEIRYYAAVGADGKITGRFNTDVHTPEQIPADAEEITEEQWNTFLKTPHRKVNGVWEEIPPLTQAELDEIERNRPRTPLELAQAKIVQMEEENATLKERQRQMDGDFAAFVDQYYTDNPDKA